MYVYVSSLSALVGLGVTVTLSFREGLWSAESAYKSADTFLITADVLTGPYRYIFAVKFSVYSRGAGVRLDAVGIEEFIPYEEYEPEEDIFDVA